MSTEKYQTARKQDPLQSYGTNQSLTSS